MLANLNKKNIYGHLTANHKCWGSKNPIIIKAILTNIAKKIAPLRISLPCSFSALGPKGLVFGANIECIDTGLMSPMILTHSFLWVILDDPCTLRGFLNKVD